MPFVHATPNTDEDPSDGPGRLNPDPTDAALVAAAHAHPAAFVPLYERHVTPIYRYCLFKLGSREAAEDATSQVFLEAFRDLAHFRGGLFAGWLFRIAQHTVIDTQRRRRRMRHDLPIDAADELPDPQAFDQDLSATTITVRMALEALPTTERQVLELQLAGWTSAQIGAALGCSASSVRMARAQGLKRLRVYLSDPLSEPAVEPQRGGHPC